MVKNLFLSLSLLFICTLSSSAEMNILVQDPGGHPKKSDHIKVGQKFRLLADREIKLAGYTAKVSIGSIGLKIHEGELFIAKGQIHILKRKAEGKNNKNKALVIRHPWGLLKSYGGDHLLVNQDEEIRWFHEDQSPDANFQYKSKSIDLIGGQAFIANRSEAHIIEAKKGQLDSHQIYFSSKQSLLLTTRLVGTSTPATSGRNQSKQAFIQSQTVLKARKHAQAQARRNFNF